MVWLAGGDQAAQLVAIGKAAREVLADYLEAVELAEPVELPRVVRNPDDDHVRRLVAQSTSG